MRKIFVLAIITAALFFSACKKTDNYTQLNVNDYFPLVVGKYITYQLDSTVYINFGSSVAVHSYQVKYAVDAKITDNLGRPAYRIIRYIRNTATDPWASDNTFAAVPTGNTVELIENNLRYIKLVSPVRDGYSWKGNSYIETTSLNSDLKYLNDWDYTYDSVNVKTTVGAFSLDSTLKVDQRDETLGTPSNPALYSERNISNEKYTKGIGLVYRYFLHTEYQPPTSNPGRYSDGSYGIKLTMIDHN